MTSFPRRIALLGSTGSIGRQTLDVVRCFPEHFRVVALAARSNVSLLAQQAREFGPALTACFAETPEIERAAREALPEVVLGEQGLLEVATQSDVDIVVAATSGLTGLSPTLAAIDSGKTIALANKETLVMAGHLVTQAAHRAGVSILPIDSEHSAIWQCLRGENTAEVNRLILTASGGPFRRATLDQLRSVTVEQALAHPTWSMGPKITIDSATLMNKGLEVLEAHWLFDIPYSAIDVVIHPQSVVHGIAEFRDGSMIAQLSVPDMRLPIQLALAWPERLPTGVEPFRLADPSKPTRLAFEPVDRETFPALDLAYRVGRLGSTFPAVMNAANEVAVMAFLDGKIPLTRVSEVAAVVVEEHEPAAVVSVVGLYREDAWARQRAAEVAAER